MGKEYRVIGAFDTETTNLGNIAEGYKAFPILYQLGLLSCNVENLTIENCANNVTVDVFRDCESLYTRLETIISGNNNYVPVILVHNLAFDMYALAPWLNGHDCKVLAKTARKPITITVMDSGDPSLVFLDTLGLFMKSLKTLGQECGMPKAVGDWDYLKIRTPDTPLTDDEIFYAKRDIETLLVYMGYFLRKNPDLNPGDIGLKVVTKTGVVRSKRMTHLGGLKGDGLKKTVNQLWNYHNRTQAPKTDSELFTMHACTRGGFTFCASKHASKVYIADDVHTIAAFDATSQHPAQMCSRLYPVNFLSASKEELIAAMDCVASVSVDRMLAKWARPFPCAFNALFAFDNLRPKNGSMYEKHGIYPLASARLANRQSAVSLDDMDNQSFEEFRSMLGSKGYADYAENPRILFGKIESADYCELWLTELAFWEVCQAYDFDSCKPIGGYLTLNFRKPTDLSVLSVMRFYEAKSTMKLSMHDGNAERLRGLFPDSLVERMEEGDASEQELKDYYMLSKADLNALFG